MNEKHIEPGLLQVFRLFVSVQWGLLLFTFCAEALDEETELGFLTMFVTSHTSLLMLVLFWKRLHRWLGRYLLPTALSIATLGPLLAYPLTVAFRMRAGQIGDEAAVDEGGLILWLFIPMVLISAQYGMRIMLTFCFGTAMLEIFLNLPLALSNGPNIDHIIEQAIVRVLLFVMVGYVVVRLINAQRHQRTALAQANADLALYASTQEQLTVSRERNRMARELHDTVAHSLSAVAVQLQALRVLLDTDPVAAKTTVATLQTLTRSGLQEVRRALQALRASPLEDLGLVLAIHELAVSIAARAGLVLQLDLPDHLTEVRSDVEQNVYRIVEEALENVVRHANATTLSLALRQQGDTLSLCIKDDGQGFDVEQPPDEGHYGLVGMRERAKFCGGEFFLHSQKGQGTVIELRVEK